MPARSLAGLARLAGVVASATLLATTIAARGEDAAPQDPAPAAKSAPGADAPRDDAEDPQEPPALRASIDAALKKGVVWLKSAQLPDGSWGLMTTERPSYSGGESYQLPPASTSLTLYTLLKCGVPVSDPSVKRGFDWLRKNYRTKGLAYELSAALLAVTATVDPFKERVSAANAGDKVKLSGDWKKWAVELKDRLLSLRAPKGWRYWGQSADASIGAQDLSSTQFAALALFAAERCGISVDPSVWSGIIEFARAQQEATGPAHPRAVVARPARPPAPAQPPAAEPGETAGPPAPSQPEAPATDAARGFAYILGTATEPSQRLATGGMTACGLGAIMMSRFMLTTRYPKAWSAIDPDPIQQSVYDGLAWLDLHFDPVTNPSSDKLATYHVYYLYCVERAMDLIGAQRLGKHFWYFEMAERLVPRQDAKGCWDSKSTSANGRVLDTCFALLFLHRATRGGIPFPSVTGGSDVPPVEGR